jgi:hypothetical protein
MSAQEILMEEIKRQPEPVLREVLHFLKTLERAQKAGVTAPAKNVFAKWRGRGHLPAGKNTDDYLRLTRDANGS